jgi:hypothetical protein
VADSPPGAFGRVGIVKGESADFGTICEGTEPLCPGFIQPTERLSF